MAINLLEKGEAKKEKTAPEKNSDKEVVKTNTPTKPEEVGKVNAKNDLSSLLGEEFGISDWDSKTLIKPTKFDIINHLLAASKDEVGLVLRTFNTLVGGSGIGKSTLFTQMAAHIVDQSENGQLIYFDAEKTMTTQRLETLGAKSSFTTMIKKNTTIEKFFSLLKILATSRHEQLKEFGEDYIMNNPYIVVVDSIAAMGSEREIEADTDINKAMGVGAKMWSTLLTTYIDIIYRYNITVLAINQIRDKIALTPAGMKKDLVYENADTTTPKGKAIKFYSFTYANLKYKGQLKEEQYGFQAVEVEFNLIKTKNSETNRKISLVFQPSKGYSNFWSNLFFLKENGFIKTGAFYRFEDKGDLTAIFPKTWRLRESEIKYENDPDFKKAFDKAVEMAVDILYKNEDS